MHQSVECLDTDGDGVTVGVAMHHGQLAGEVGPHVDGAASVGSGLPVRPVEDPAGDRDFRILNLRCKVGLSQHNHETV